MPYDVTADGPARGGGNNRSFDAAAIEAAGAGRATSFPEVLALPSRADLRRFASWATGKRARFVAVAVAVAFFCMDLWLYTVAGEFTTAPCRQWPANMFAEQH